MSAEIKRRMAPVIDGLVGEPRPHGVRKLAGHEKLYRVRVGQYRIIYGLDDEQTIIRITRVRHRRDAYR
ncbi:MAG: type II toxin-antitoxin system RelE/ParE family toxin [Anaerolineales bacterium]|nr:type II toxin-antitoxin system RelE/ParE family toxin [Anaerolineales bacterium]